MGNTSLVGLLIYFARGTAKEMHYNLHRSGCVQKSRNTSAYVLIKHPSPKMPFFANGPVSIFYTTHGTDSGPSIVLVHGWACDAHDWSHQIPLLASLGFRVIALDLRGHGRSSAPSSISDYSMRAFAGDIIALLEHLQTGPSIIMGHSMGTVIASILAVEHPTFVKALILAHPIYCGAPPVLVEMTKEMCGNPGSAPRIVAEFFENYMYTDQTPDWIRTWHIRRVLGTDGIALAGCGQAIVELFDKVVGRSEEAKAFMKERKCPKLVFPTTVLPHAEAWEEELGLGPLDDLHKTQQGTFSHFIESERFNEAVKDWLEKRGLREKKSS